MAGKSTFHGQNRTRRFVIVAKHIFGDDLENNFKRRFAGSNLLQVTDTKIIQPDRIFAQHLADFDFSANRDERGSFFQAYLPTVSDYFDSCLDFIYDRNVTPICETETNMRGRNKLIRFAQIWR